MAYYGMYFSPTGGTKKVLDLVTKEMIRLKYEILVTVIIAKRDIHIHATSRRQQRNNRFQPVNTSRYRPFSSGFAAAICL